MFRLLGQFQATATKQQGRQALFRMDMSVLRRIISQGRALFRYHLEFYGKKLPNLSKIEPLALEVSLTPGASSAGASSGLANSSSGTLQWIGRELHAGVRKLFVDNVLRRVTSSLSGELRKKATQRLLHGNDARPFFALVGVSLASGGGMLTKENEFEGICWEIRESLLKKQEKIRRTSGSLDITPCPSPEVAESDQLSVNDLAFGPLLSKGSSAAVFAGRWKESGVEESAKDAEYPLAVKMMFNYDFESNSSAIIRAMCKEIVPCKELPDLKGLRIDEFENLKRCPPHPNVIEISHVFTDQVPMLPESLEMFPAALPKRLNEEGFGRNMSLFLVMKRYDTNLANYLRSQIDLNQKQRLLILVQLLEGIVHLNKNQIAHRDLKTDNILLDTTSDHFYPNVAITDFGCCLADKSNGLHLPFPTNETDRGGNAALMAPEVSMAKPGVWKKISYEKSDAWTVGTIIYEIFGGKNPFVLDNGVRLDSRTYEEENLPELDSFSPLTKKLKNGLLKRNPNERLSAEMAATVCHLYLWGPTVWLLPQAEKVSDSEIIQWLLTLTTKVLCCSSVDSARLEYSVIRVLLKRIRFSEVRAALDWIHSSNN